jgi:hypothetical protein
MFKNNVTLCTSFQMNPVFVILPKFTMKHVCYMSLIFQKQKQYLTVLIFENVFIA